MREEKVIKMEKYLKIVLCIFRKKTSTWHVGPDESVHHVARAVWDRRLGTSLPIPAVMGDDTVDEEALARALNATAEEEAYEMGIEYPTFQPEKKRHRGDQGARKKQMSKCTADNTVVAKTEPEGAAQTTVTLAHLIDYAVLLPGPDVLTTRYCDETTTATLTTHGTIEWRHTEYRSLSAFSVAFKRTVKPGRMADDGWKSVRYLGRGKEDGETGTEGTEADPGKEAKDENTGVLLDVLKKRLIGDQSDLAKGVISGAGEAVRLMIQKIADEKKRTDAAKPKPPAKQPKPKTEKPPVKLKPVKPVKPSKPTPQPIDRPRRERKVPHRMGENLSDLTMVECASYDDDTKSKSNKQPFSIACSFEASALMDFHSHLSSDTEIIGFLAGKWCARTKMLSITKALPAKRLFSNDANVEVELDPASVPEICEKIELENEKVVGWYHSHPLFPTNPSLRDCENQANYQVRVALTKSSGHCLPPLFQCTTPDECSSVHYGRNVYQAGNSYKYITRALFAHCI